MKIFRWLAPLVAFIFLTVNRASGAEPDWPKHIKFLSGPNGGQWFYMGDAIADILTDKLLPTSSRIGGGVSNIKDINEKSGDVAFTLNCFLAASGENEPGQAGSPTDNTAVLANVYPQVLYFLINSEFAKNNGIASVKDLIAYDDDVRFASLLPGTASEFILSILLSEGYGTTTDKLSKRGWHISFGNYAEIADELVAGDLDCFAYTAGTDVPLIHTIEENMDVTILPVEKEVLDKLAARFHTSAYVITKGAYKGVSEPVLTLGDYTSLIVRADLPESLVYEITKTLWENRDTVAKAISDFAGLSPVTALSNDFPMHPGALKFWKELNSGGAR
jgi:TRAP transporter TAXI family solute receptor